MGRSLIHSCLFTQTSAEVSCVQRFVYSAPEAPEIMSSRIPEFNGSYKKWAWTIIEGWMSWEIRRKFYGKWDLQREQGMRESKCEPRPTVTCLPLRVPTTVIKFHRTWNPSTLHWCAGRAHLTAKSYYRQDYVKCSLLSKAITETDLILSGVSNGASAERRSFGVKRHCLTLNVMYRHAFEL